MPTHFPGTTDAPTTPGRKLRVRIDVPDTVLASPPYAVAREYSRVGSPYFPGVSVRFLNNVGWQIEPYQATISNLHEKTVLNDAIYANGGAITVPSGILSKNEWRDDSGDITGLGTPVSGTNSTGDPHYRKEPTGDWSTTSYHIADSYGADSSTWTYSADLVAKGTSNHDYKNEGLCLRVSETGFTLATPSAHREFYFSGPASLHKGIAGTGSYCVTFYGDGKAVLREKLSVTGLFGQDPSGFMPVHDFRWASQNDAMACSHYFEIQSKTRTNVARGAIGVILFIVGTSGVAPALAAGTSVLMGFGGTPSTDVFRYDVPYDGTASPPTTDPQPIRLKSRRDMRHKWQISRLKYPTAATLIDAPFSFPGNSGYYEGQTFRVIWMGDLPSGTGVAIQCYDRNGGFTGTTPMTQTASGSYTDATGHTWGGWADYPCSSDGRDMQYEAYYVMTGDGWKTPTIERVRYQRDAVYIDIAPGEISTKDNPMAGPFEVQIVGQDSDTSHNTATFVIHDFDDVFSDSLFYRAGQAIVIDTEYAGVDWSDPANEGKQAVLFRGYIASITVTQGGKQTSSTGFDKDIPGPSYRVFHCNCNGQWHRATEQFAPFTFDFSYDLTVTAGVALPYGTPYKVTDAIRTCFPWMGYPPSMVNIPDIATRLYPKMGADASANVLTYGQNLLEFVQRIAHDYIYRVIHFAENSGTGTDPTLWWGQWTLIAVPRTPYNDLAYFSRFAPSGDSTPHIVSPHMLGAWPKVTVSGQDQLGAPLFKWSMKIIPCQGNHITVSAVSAPNGNASIDVLPCTTYNAKSYNIDPRVTTADTHDLDFVGRAIPLSCGDFSLPSASAVKTTNRIILNSLRGTKQLSGTSPLLLVTNSHDSSQKRPRPLRIGDTVTVEGERYMFRCANIGALKDTQQMMEFEADLQREPL